MVRTLLVSWLVGPWTAGYWTVLAVLAGAGTCWLLVPAPSRLLTRLDRRPRSLVRAPTEETLPARTRALGGVALGSGAWWLLSDLLGWWSLAAALLVGVGVAAALGRVVPAEVRRARAAVAGSLPGTLDLIGACLRAGLPLRAAVTVVADAVAGPLGQRLKLVVAHLELGGHESDAWRQLNDDPQLGRLADDIARAAGTGAGPVGLLADHASDARAQWQATAEQRARTVGVHTVLPLMCCYLPAFLAIGIFPIVAGFVAGFLG